MTTLDTLLQLLSVSVEADGRRRLARGVTEATEMTEADDSGGGDGVGDALATAACRCCLCQGRQTDAGDWQEVSDAGDWQEVADGGRGV